VHILVFRPIWCGKPGAKQVHIETEKNLETGQRMVYLRYTIVVEVPAREKIQQGEMEICQRMEVTPKKHRVSKYEGESQNTNKPGAFFYVS